MLTLEVEPIRSNGPAAGAQSRMLAGGLSVLILFAFALAAGVSAGQLLATIGGSATQHKGPERAVAPQIVERREVRRVVDRPVPALIARTNSSTTDQRFHPADVLWLGARCRPLRAEMLALPPPVA